MKAAFYTLGCKVNQYESHAMSYALRRRGYTIVPLDAAPDVIIVNSCTVTAESDRKTRQHVRSLRRHNPEAVLILTGCMPQAFPEISSALKEADIVLGNTDNTIIPDVIDEFISTGERIVRIDEHKKGEKFVSAPVEGFGEKTRAYIKIEDGCNHFCTYCIIPMARGRVRSKPLSQISEEAQSLAASGYKDITLVGINLTAFGRDTAYDICDAVDCISEIDGISRIRLGSIEPDDFNDKMIDRLRSNPKFCPHFHLSLQSGCDETLRRMNRHYDTAFYRNLCDKLRVDFEDCTVTTDVMVGFPGETDEEFEQSLSFVKSIGFADAHVFAYSRRSGTVAYKMQDQMPNSVKAERSRRMIKAVSEVRNVYLKSKIGSICEVLAESRTDDINFSGHTKNYLEVKFPSDSDVSGSFINVKITGVTGGILTGKII